MWTCSRLQKETRANPAQLYPCVRSSSVSRRGLGSGAPRPVSGDGCLKHEITNLGAPFHTARPCLPQPWAAGNSKEVKGDTLRDGLTYLACTSSSWPCQWALCFSHYTWNVSSGCEEWAECFPCGCGSASDGTFWLKHFGDWEGTMVGLWGTQSQGDVPSSHSHMGKEWGSYLHARRTRETIPGQP